MRSTPLSPARPRRSAAARRPTTSARRTRRRGTPLVLAAALLLAVTTAVATGATAAAQTTPSPATVPASDVTAPSATSPEPLRTPSILPQPNSGHAPRDPGDRGGWWQEALFVGICLAILIMIGLVWRDSRRQRRRQGRLGAATRVAPAPGAADPVGAASGDRSG